MENVTREIFSQKGKLMELYKLLRRKELYSNFIDRDMFTQYQTLIAEVLELGDEINENNKEKIIKELGDVIFTLFLSIQGLLKKGIIEPSDINLSIEQLKDKIYKRSPQLLYGKKESHEKEEELWYSNK